MSLKDCKMFVNFEEYFIKSVYDENVISKLPVSTVFNTKEHGDEQEENTYYHWIIW